MPSSRLFLHDGLTGRPVRIASDDTIVVSSVDADWEGIALERQHLPPSEPDGYMPWHLLSVQVTPPTRFVDFTAARSREVAQRRGDVIFRPAGVVTRAAWEGTADTINVALSPVVVAGVAAEMLDGGAVEFSESQFRSDVRVWHLACALLQALESGSDPGLFVESVRTALAAHLVDMYGVRRRVARRGPTLSPAELGRVSELVNAGLAGRLSLAELAAAVPMSPYHFSRAFKATAGMTPHEFVVRRRVDAAKTLLRRGDLLVDEVARRTGFVDASHLARQFRRHVGTTPGRYAASWSPPRAASSA